MKYRKMGLDFVSKQFEKNKEYICQPRLKGLRLTAEEIGGKMYLFRQSTKQFNFLSLQEELNFILGKFDFITHLEGVLVVEGKRLIKDIRNVASYIDDSVNTPITDDLKQRKIKFFIQDLPMDNIEASNRRRLLEEIKSTISSANLKFVSINTGKIIDNVRSLMNLVAEHSSLGYEEMICTNVKSVYDPGKQSYNKFIV